MLAFLRPSGTKPTGSPRSASPGVFTLQFSSPFLSPPPCPSPGVNLLPTPCCFLFVSPKAPFCPVSRFAAPREEVGTLVHLVVQRPRKGEVHPLNKGGTGCVATAFFDLETSKAPSFVLISVVSQEAHVQKVATAVLVLLCPGAKPRAGGPTLLCALYLPQCNDYSSKHTFATLGARMRCQLPYQKGICDALDSWAIKGMRENLRSCFAILRMRSRHPRTHGGPRHSRSFPVAPGTAWSFRGKQGWSGEC